MVECGKQTYHHLVLILQTRTRWTELESSVPRTGHGGHQTGSGRGYSHPHYAASGPYNPEDRKYIMYFRKSPILNSTFFKSDKPSAFRKTWLSTLSHLEWVLPMTKPFLSALCQPFSPKPKELLHILPYCL